MTSHIFKSPLREALEARKEKPKPPRKEHMVTPLRYPGGKVWLAEVAEAWAATHGRKALLEGFAGGASVGLYLMSRRAIQRLFLVDLDKRVTRFWKILFEYPAAHAKQVIKRIETFTPEEAELRAALSRRWDTPADYAFAVLIQNRFAASGILDFGKSLRKSGYRNRGLESMWYPETLAERIESLMALRSRVHVACENFYGVFVPENAAAYLDPPYPSAGKRLYAKSAHDLEDLAAWLAAHRDTPTLVTYEDVGTGLFERAGLAAARVAMQSGKAEVKREVVAASHHSTVLEGLL